MAGCNHFRLTVDEENEETTLGLDECKISDLLKDQAGVVSVLESSSPK